MTIKNTQQKVGKEIYERALGDRSGFDINMFDMDIILEIYQAIGEAANEVVMKEIVSY